MPLANRLGSARRYSANVVVNANTKLIITQSITLKRDTQHSIMLNAVVINVVAPIGQPLPVNETLSKKMTMKLGFLDGDSISISVLTI